MSSAAPLPRLSAILRVFLSESGPVDTDGEYLKRQAFLGVRGGGNGGAAHPLVARGLRWLDMEAIKKSSTTPAELKRMRGVFRSFVDVVARIAGNEGNESVDASTLHLYTAFSDPSGSRDDLVGTYGTIPDQEWLEAERLAARLRAWQGDSRLFPGSDKQGAALGTSAALPVLHPHEFGRDIPFALPAAVGGGGRGLNWVGHAAEGAAGAASSAAVGANGPAGPTGAPAGGAVFDDDGGGDGGGDYDQKQDDSFSEAMWLLARCTEHVNNVGPGAMMMPGAVATNVLQLLQEVESEGDLQGRLFDLLGVQGFELIGEVLQRRAVLTGVSVAHIEAMCDDARPGHPDEQPRAPRSRGQRREEQRQRKKGVRVGGLSNDALAGQGFDPKYLAQERALGLQKNQMGNRGYEAKLDVGEAMSSFEAKRSLPVGTTRTVKKGYEEVYVPAVKPRSDPAKLVPVTEFDDFAQLAFGNIKTLNRMQSLVYQSAYHSNENLLICAPTGAGKTNVAMMAVLHTLKANMDRGVIRKDQFKIIYVAPMKALAQEVVRTFGTRLKPLQIAVRELTGDMQLSKKEIEQTQMIVTTPEKWDVVTRKSGNASLITLVRLLIIDEVHLLADERGSVIESIVARTLRQVETSQSVIRIVGLSATLPNYEDVGRFLRVNPHKGLFHFDGSFRPVPLEQRFIGVTETNEWKQRKVMNDIAYEKALESCRQGFQVMIFVHTRKGTNATAQALRELAGKNSTTGVFAPTDHKLVGLRRRDVQKSRNHDLRDLYEFGFGIHHAGMLRPDRNLTESLFSQGLIKVLCCTATLAWGVNLPAHTVIIKGTDVYNAKAGGVRPLGVLDVQQIFGRAGRPQFEASGEGIIITPHADLSRYLAMLTRQIPIESQFLSRLPDNLNAEIVSGTVTNVREAVRWLSYTYLYVRMLRNPLVYGIPWDEREADPTLQGHCTALIHEAAKRLDECRMVRFVRSSDQLAVTHLGRVASHFYIISESVELFNSALYPTMADADILQLIAESKELENVTVRDDELPELDLLKKESAPFPIKIGIENNSGKCNLLMQAYISQARPRGFTLISDTAYVAQNAARVARGLFEICLKRGWSNVAERFLSVSKSIDRRMWWDQHPLRQFKKGLPEDIIVKLERPDPRGRKHPIATLKDMSPREIGQLIRNGRMGDRVSDLVSQFPCMDVDVVVKPVTRGILHILVKLTPDFVWSTAAHGNVEPWWVWMEDGQNETIYHSEYVVLEKKQHQSGEPLELAFTVPVFEPLPSQYYLRVVSDRWVGAQTITAVSFQHLILPEEHPPHTELLALEPLPVGALQNKKYESLYRGKFDFFNSVQTQFFHVLYHTDRNVLLGAPTGSGKTVAAELAVMRLFACHPGAKVVYIAPLKALARERIKDWTKKFGLLNRRVIELTGDFTPDFAALQRADILVTTPEKWDGISRLWHRRDYVKKVGLVIIDEIHLLGEDRGPVLEVIVSRMRYIASQTQQPVRVVGLSTALANARDLADWLAIDRVGLYNFKPSVRPVPLEVHIQGFPGKHYCPRMATMNKPTYAAIRTYSPTKPSLVFVSSRRQTRLTALDLISFCAQDENPKQFLHMPELEIAGLCDRVQDQALKHTLAFGIGIHHGGLKKHDRELVEELFCDGKIQVLVCTSTLAWGVNFPAHLVVVKGTEYFDGKTRRYVDFPITDVLQMMGRAGRPQFDKTGVACILVHEPKKNFYRKFLYEPFPVESQLLDQLHNHINAEVAGGAIRHKLDAVDYLTWTYLFRRLVRNPSYYQLEDASPAGVRKFLDDLSQGILADLQQSGCLELDEGDVGGTGEEGPGGAGAVGPEKGLRITPTTLGHIASFYYIDHTTAGLFQERLRVLSEDYVGASTIDLVHVVALLLSDAAEFDELPVRHNEDKLNAELARCVRWEVDNLSFDSPHTKTFLLLQARFGSVALPISDYINDTKSVLDQAMRVINAMVDIAADQGLLEMTLACMHLAQMVAGGRYMDASTLDQVPQVSPESATLLADRGISSLSELIAVAANEESRLRSLLKRKMSSADIGQLVSSLGAFPVVKVAWAVHLARDDDADTMGPLLAPGPDGKLTVDCDVDAYCVVRLAPMGASGNRDRGQRGSRHGGARKGGKGDDTKKTGWWLMLGDTGTGELLALKRLTLSSRPREERLAFATETDPGCEMTLALFLVSDAIGGLDQQHSMTLSMRQ